MRAQQGRSRLPGRHWWQGDTAIARPQRRPIDPQFDGRHAGVSARISRPPAAGTPAPRPSCLPAAWRCCHQMMRHSLHLLRTKLRLNSW